MVYSVCIYIYIHIQQIYIKNRYICICIICVNTIYICILCIIMYLYVIYI